jgi:hypothetical protein
VALRTNSAVEAEVEYAPAHVAGVSSLRPCLAIWALTSILSVAVGSGIALALGKSFTYPWRIWDAGWFLYVAQHGYSLGAVEHAKSPAFYPLYPGVLKFAGLLIGGNLVVAGVLIALPLTLAAFVLLFVLAREQVGEEAARWSVAYLALFPYAFFLHALYSEAAFLACAIAAFLAAERKRFLAAGVLTGLAMLARPAGIAVLAGILLFTLRRPHRAANALRVSTALGVFSVFPVLLAVQGRSPLAFMKAEHGWRSYSGHDPLGLLTAPFESVFDGARAAGTGVRGIVDTLGHGSALSPYAIHDLAAFVLLVIFLALSALAWRRLGSPYGVYCGVSLAIPLVARPLAAPLLSLPRFVLVLFPCFIVLGTLPLRPRWHGVILGTCCAGLVGLLYLWNHGGHFVA